MEGLVGEVLNMYRERSYMRVIDGEESDLDALSWMVDHLKFFENSVRVEEGQRISREECVAEDFVRQDNEISHELAERHEDDPFIQSVYRELLKIYDECGY